MNTRPADPSPAKDSPGRATGAPAAVLYATTALLAAGVLWRVVRYALGFPIWGDEAFVAVNLLVRDYAGMIAPLEYGQIVPLLFMWVELAVCRALGSGELALRLFPFVAGLATLALFWRFVAAALPPWPGLIALGFLAAAYYPVRHAAEVKPYASDLFVSLLLTMLTWRLIARVGQASSDAEGRRYGAAGGGFLRYLPLVLLAAVVPWASYPAVFVAGGCVLTLAWCWWRDRRTGDHSSARSLTAAARLNAHSHSRAALIGVLAFGAVLAASFLAMHVLYGKPHAEAAVGITEIDMWRMAFPPLSEPWKLPVWLVGVHTGNMMAYPVGGQTPASAGTLVLVILGAVRLWRMNRGAVPGGWIARPTAGERLNRRLLLLLLAPLPLTLFAAALEKYPYGGSARTSLYMAPAFCLLGGLGLYTLCGYIVLLRRRWTGMRALGRRLFGRDLKLAHLVLGAAAGLALIAVGGATRDITRPYKTEAVVRSYDAVRALAERAEPGDVWVIFNAIERVEYAPYLGEWRGTGGQFVFDVLRFAPVPVAWSPPPGEVPPNAGRIWLMAYRGVKADFPQEQLDAYLAPLRERFGEPEAERFMIKEVREGREALEVYRFPKRDR